MRSIGTIEIRSTFSCEFKMLALVFTNWDVCCSTASISHRKLCLKHQSARKKTDL